MKNLACVLVIVTVTMLLVCTPFAQTKVTQLIIANSNGQIKLNAPTVPSSGTRTFEFPSSPTGSKFVMTESTSGQTIGGSITFTGPVTLGDQLSLTFGGSNGNSGDVLVSDGDGGASWQAPSGGGGGVPTTRTLTTTSPLTIGGGASADLSANRTIAFDFDIANEWFGAQTFPETTEQGNLLINSINSGDQPIGVAQGGTGRTTVTSDRLIIGNGTAALAEVVSGTDGDVLKLVGGVPTWQSEYTEIVLDGDTTNGTASPLQEIKGFSFVVGANEVWEYEAMLRLGSSGSNGLTFGVDVPSGSASGIVSASTTAISGSTARIAGDNVASSALCTSSDQNHFAFVKGMVVIGVTGGTVYLKWGRGGSGSSTIYSNSRLKIRKLS